MLRNHGRRPHSPTAAHRAKLSAKAKAQHAARRGYEVPPDKRRLYEYYLSLRTRGDKSWTYEKIGKAIGVLSVLLMLEGWGGLTAQAHHAPSGWQYPGDCCGKLDCAPIEPSGVKWTPSGWLIKITQEVIPFEEARESGDSDWHRCRTISTDMRSPTRRGMQDKRRCLYVPAPEN